MTLLKTTHKLYFIPLLCSLLFWTNLAWGQRSEQDSLEQVLSTYDKEDTIKAIMLNRVSYLYHDNDPKKGIAYGEQGLALSQKLGLRRVEAQALNSIGTNLWAQSLHDSALVYYSKSLDIKIERNDTSGIAATYMNMAVMYQQKDEKVKALKCYAKAFPLAQQAKDSLVISALLLNTGQFYTSIGDYHQGLNYYLKVLPISKKIKYTSGTFNSLSGIGYMYSKLNQYEDALPYQLQYLKLADSINSKRSIALASNDLADSYLELGQVEQSIKNYTKALGIQRKIGSNNLVVSNLIGLGNAWKTQNYDSAIKYYEEALLLNKNLQGARKLQRNANILNGLGECHEYKQEYQKAISIYKEALEDGKTSKRFELWKVSAHNLSRCYEKLGILTKALLYQKAYSSATDSIQKVNDIEDKERLKVRFEAEKEMRAMATEQEKNKMAFQAKIQQQKNFRNGAVIFGALILLVAMGYYRSYKRKQRDNALLSEQNDQIMEQKEELTQQSEELKATNDRLHELSSFKDGFTHMIAHDMKTPLSNIITITDGIKEDNYVQINMAGKQLLQLITNMLEVQKFEEAAPNLSFTNIHVLNLLKEALATVSPLAQVKSISLRYDATHNYVLYADYDMILRVLVNLLSNGIKYSPSSGIVNTKIEAYGNDQAMITVIDQGGGIEAAHLPHIFDRFWQAKATKAGIAKSTGLGLSYCKLAIEAHGGTIKVKSTPGVGTSFSVFLPVKAVADHSEDNLTNATKQEFILAKEAATITQFAERFKRTKIYEASSLMASLSEMEALGLKSIWKEEITSAIYYGNKAKYEQLVDMVAPEQV